MVQAALDLGIVIAPDDLDPEFLRAHLCQVHDFSWYIGLCPQPEMTARLKLRLVLNVRIDVTVIFTQVFLTVLDALAKGVIEPAPDIQVVQRRADEKNIQALQIRLRR